ncbi:AraC family transcriptional regulator [Paenibacillus sp. MBLB4367]|uniref:AraC family transcriptional regulator n=1 Tax=Paenibacillus sp. MBLB4367 TaxID=3384767 RepID=UPI00390843E8
MNRNTFPLLTGAERKLPLFVTSVGGWYNQERMLRETGFPDYQWIQTLGGEGVLHTDHMTAGLSKGQGMLLIPHERHEYYATKEPWEVMWVSFNGSMAKELLASLSFTHSQTLYVSHPDTILKKMHAALSLLDAHTSLTGFECSSLMYQMLLDLHTYASPLEVRTKRQHYEQLFPVLSYIEKNFRQPISLEMIASRLQLSPQYTCHLFQQTLGMRPFEYINKFRLSKAKELLLAQMAMDVKEVAQHVGYEHASYFIKLFKREEGVTPSAFRRIHR